MAGSSLSILGDATTLPAPTAGGLTVKSVVGEIDIDTIELLGGIDGEHQSPSGSGGDGGNAGSLKLTTMMGDVQVSTVISQGGNGGMAGSTGTGGSGGAAGSATLNVQSGMLTIQDTESMPPAAWAEPVRAVRKEPARVARVRRSRSTR